MDETLAVNVTQVLIVLIGVSVHYLPLECGTLFLDCITVQILWLLLYTYCTFSVVIYYKSKSYLFIKSRKPYRENPWIRNTWLGIKVKYIQNKQEAISLLFKFLLGQE